MSISTMYGFAMTVILTSFLIVPGLAGASGPRRALRRRNASKSV